jgi:antitoxin (DNA-binding transcriptional repressor) of toxin-antitoxin stability system
MKKSSNSIDSLKEKPSAVLREIAVMPGFGETISVRSAKAHLSALLELVVGGREITITSGGKPKATIAAPRQPKHVPFTGTREHLAKMPPWSGGPTADEIIRAERDSRP